MKALHKTLQAATFVAAFFAYPALAELQLGAAAMAQYDSNVLTDDEVTLQTTAATGTKLSAFAGYGGRLPDSIPGNLQWQGRYDVSKSSWQNVTGYDSLLQSGYLRLSRKGRFSPEVSLLMADAQVEGQDFLELKRVSPAIGYLWSSDWYGRAQLDLSQKTFAQYPERDSDQLRARLMLYWLMDKTRRYLSVQAGIKREDASDPLYSYQAFTGRLRWKDTFGPVRWDIGMKTELRQYDEIRESLGEERQDQRYRFSTGVEWPIAAGFSFVAEAGHDIYRSNLDVADYSQNRLEAGIEWEY